MTDDYNRNYRRRTGRLDRALTWCRWYSSTGVWGPMPLGVSSGERREVMTGSGMEREDIAQPKATATQAMAQWQAPTPPGAGSRFRQRKE